MSTTRAALSLIAFAVFIALMPWEVSAQQTLSHVFSGSVLVGGQAPPNDSVLTAWTGGRRIGQVPVRQGRFRIVIPQRNDVSFAGREVSFRLDGRKVRGTGIWKGGGTTELKLTLTKNEYLNPQAVQIPAQPPTSSSDQSFVGPEPPVCEKLRLDDSLNGILTGKIRNGTLSIPSEFKVNLKQSGCRIAGELKIVSPLLHGSGPLHGTVDGNFVRFTVPEKTNDAGEDLNFSGIIDSNRIAGNYFLPRSKLVGEWILLTEITSANRTLIARLLSEARSKLEKQAAAVTQRQAETGNLTDSLRNSRTGSRTGSNEAPLTANPTLASSENELSPSKSATARTEDLKNRGFFSNSVSVDSNSFNGLDPTMLAVIGILMTLMATAVQLFRGN